MNFDQLTPYLQQLFTAAQSYATQYGPQAWNTVLWVYKIDALTTLIPCFVIFTLSLIGLGVCRLIWNLGVSKLAVYNEGKDRYRKDDMSDMSQSYISFVGAGACMIALLVCTTLFLNIWTWIEFFRPDLYIAHEALNKVLSGGK